MGVRRHGRISLKTNYNKGFEKYWKATQTLFSVFVFKTILNSPSALVFIYKQEKSPTTLGNF